MRYALAFCLALFSTAVFGEEKNRKRNSRPIYCWPSGSG